MDVSNEQRERDKSRRGDKPTRFSNNDRSKERKSSKNRVYVSNVPYEFKWNELKDLFRTQVGDVAYVQLFNDENDKPRGCGIVEFNNPDSLKKAMEVMHRFALEGRRLVIKEDYGIERDKYGHIIKGNVRNDSERRNMRMNTNRMEVPFNSGHLEGDQFNTYGLSAQFLESINVNGPLLTRIFVANLDYKVDKVKLKEVFKMAGKVRLIDLSLDKEGNSRGFAIVEYSHPVEAVQAISMFDKQMLFDRVITVRMDRVSGEREIKLPEGLQGIGPGLGSNGEPLYDVTRYIPQNTTAVRQIAGVNVGLMGAIPSTINGSGLGNSGQINLQALQSQILQQGLATGDLGISVGSNMNTPFQNGFNANGNMATFGQSGMSSNYPASNMGRPIMPNDFGNRQGADSAQAMSFGQNMFSSDSTDHKNKMDTVLIDNLPSSISWQLLREKFSEAGPVDFADKTDMYTGMVRFKNPLNAEKAIKMFDRTRIDGRTIDVQYY